MARCAVAAQKIMRLIHVVQHTSAEYLGLIEDHLEGRALRFKYYRPFAQGNALPQMDAMSDGLILLGGGPWGSAGARDAPTLKEEVRLAHACLMREWPVVGIGLGAQILADLGLKTIRLLTNNPRKVVGLEGYGLKIVEQVAIRVKPNPHNARYLKTKRRKMGHLL